MGDFSADILTSLLKKNPPTSDAHLQSVLELKVLKRDSNMMLDPLSTFDVDESLDKREQETSVTKPY